MNIRYVNVDGNYYVIDDKGNFIPKGNSGNFEEILVTENVIERLKEEISFLEYQKKFEKKLTKPKEIKKLNIVKLTMHLFGFSAFFLAVFGIVLFATSPMLSTPSLFTLLSFLVPVSLILSSLIVSNEKNLNQTELEIYQEEEEEYQISLKKAKGREKQLAFLKRKLTSEEEHLENLMNKQEKQEALTPLEVKLVQDKERLEELKQQLQFYYDLGYNETTKEEFTKVKEKKELRK